jgi:hypothetical protein
MSLLVSTGTRTLCISKSDARFSLEGVKEKVVEAEGIPFGDVYFSLDGRVLRDDDNDFMLPDSPFVLLRLHVRGLLGGKGGFGALLRASTIKVGAKKTDDYTACRDLNGKT